MSDVATGPSFGVVICAWSDARWELLVDAVESVRRQSRPPEQLAVVIDHNDALLARASEAFPDARVVPSRGRPGLSGARNTGFSELETDIAAFLDDDAAADGDWLEAMAREFDDPSVISVGGWVAPRWESSAHSWLAPELYWIVGCSYRGLPTAVAEIRNPIGANMAFRRAALVSLGGFREDVGRIGERPLGDEETDLAIRARARWPDARILHVPAARVAHVVPLTRTRWSYLVSRCWAEGRSKAVLSGAVGTSHALASERTYVLRALPAGIGRGLLDALRGDRTGPGRAASIVVALTVTIAGYVFGRLNALT
ncbi:MAG: glycosyltransferase family 2 protein [Solirubrobacteraceae bacterium]